MVFIIFLECQLSFTLCLFVLLNKTLTVKQNPREASSRGVSHKVGLQGREIGQFVCLFVWLIKTRTLKPLRCFHSWCLSFTQPSTSKSHIAQAYKVILPNVCLFVCCNKTAKLYMLLCWEGSKPPGSDHTRTEARSSCSILPSSPSLLPGDVSSMCRANSREDERDMQSRQDTAASYSFGHPVLFHLTAPVCVLASRTDK